MIDAYVASWFTKILPLPAYCYNKDGLPCIIIFDRTLDFRIFVLLDDLLDLLLYLLLKLADELLLPSEDDFYEFCELL